MLLDVNNKSINGSVKGLKSYKKTKIKVAKISPGGSGKSSVWVGASGYKQIF